MSRWALLIAFLFSSCSYIVEMDGGKNYTARALSGNKLVLAFSHNVGGETHPCGCRHFPLGGLPQLAGQLNDLKKQGEVVYVDTGDLFFPSSVLVASVQKSLTFTARQLIKAKKDLGLAYLVPGDQDFAAGLPFVQEVASQFDYLVANLQDEKAFRHKRWARLDRGDARVYLVGLVDPSTMPPHLAPLFASPESALGAVIEEIKKDGWDSSNVTHRLVVLSHSGMDADHALAKKYPSIDWVIGAHDQKFTQKEETEGSTRLVQVLSRNHYLGAISMDLVGPKTQDSFFVHEIREERSELLKPNPFIAFLDNHKVELAKIQAEEQNALTMNSNSNMPSAPLSDARSCLDCHKPQVSHWEKTTHALAYATLVRAKAQDNPACIKCHSLGHENPLGFKSTKDVVTFKMDEDRSVNKKAMEEAHASYWAQAFRVMPKDQIRGMSPNQIAKAARGWATMDDRFKHKHVVVERNFANVQCLNCHDKPSEHPFEATKDPRTGAQKKQAIQDKCLACHDPDQSPEWYAKGPNGRPSGVDKEALEAHYKRMACPKL